MVSRNGDTFSFAIGIVAGILALIAVILTCIGNSLPSWYVGTSLNSTAIVAQANLFSVCYVPNATQTTVSSSSSMTCVSYTSFQCSTTSYLSTVFNVSTYASGCTNPNTDNSAYYNFNAPISQTSIDSFYRLRASAALSIVSILFIFFSALFGLLTGILLLNVYLVYIAPILATLAVIFGICCLVVAGSVFNYTGNGLALFVAGIVLETIAIPLFAIIAGRLHILGIRKTNEEDETMFIERPSQNIIVRRVQKRKS